jgi:antitoxin MazE
MKISITSWIKRLVFRIPLSVAWEALLDSGAKVELSIENGRLRVRSVQPRGNTLNDLLKGVRKSNLHGEIPTGPPVGREAW